MNIRVQFFLLVAAIAVFSFFCIHYLTNFGITSLAYRHIITTFLSYGLFFLLVRGWIFLHQKTDALASIVSEKTSTLRSNKNKKTRWYDIFQFPDISFGGDVLAVIGLVFLICWFAYFTLSWFYVDGPLVLFDTAVEYSIFAGLLKIKSKKGEQWYEHLFKRTWQPFLIVLVVGCIMSSIIQDQQLAKNETINGKPKSDESHY